MLKKNLQVTAAVATAAIIVWITVQALSGSPSPTKNFWPVVFLIAGVLSGMLLGRLTRHNVSPSTCKEKNDQGGCCFRLLLTVIDEGVVTVDAHHNIVFVNNQLLSMLGYLPHELIGQPFNCLIESSQEVLLDAKACEETGQCEKNFLCRDGSSKHLLCTITSIPGHLGTAETHCIFLVDLSERHRAEMERLQLEKQAMQAQKTESLGLVAGGIAHDFNNILTAILGNVGLAMINLQDSDPARKNLVRIEESALRAASLARQMLAYSGRSLLRVGKLDINRLLSELRESLETYLSKEDHLVLDLAQGLPPLDADAEQLRQVIKGLVQNAAEALQGKSGTITISTRLQPVDPADNDIPVSPCGHVEVTVADTGCGMSREVMERIFDPYFSTKFIGRGLGLSAVQGIIRGHNGAIEVESEPGSGSVFRVALPTLELPADFSVIDTEPKISLTQGATVLIVDDEESVLEVGKAMLKRLGCHVHTARCGHEALQQYQQLASKIDCIVLDMTMPDMDGRECLDQLRQVNDSVKVVIASGYSGAVVATAFIPGSVSAFLQKPYSAITIAAAIEQALREESSALKHGQDAAPLL